MCFGTLSNAERRSLSCTYTIVPSAKVERALTPIHTQSLLGRVRDWMYPLNSIRWRVENRSGGFLLQIIEGIL